MQVTFTVFVFHIFYRKSIIYKFYPCATIAVRRMEMTDLFYLLFYLATTKICMMSSVKAVL